MLGNLVTRKLTNRSCNMLLKRSRPLLNQALRASGLGALLHRPAAVCSQPAGGAGEAQENARGEQRWRQEPSRGDAGSTIPPKELLRRGCPSFSVPDPPRRGQAAQRIRRRARGAPGAAGGGSCRRAGCTALLPRSRWARPLPQQHLMAPPPGQTHRHQEPLSHSSPFQQLPPRSRRSAVDKPSASRQQRCL